MKSFSNETLIFFFRKLWVSYILDLAKTYCIAWEEICQDSLSYSQGLSRCYYENGLVKYSDIWFQLQYCKILEDVKLKFIVAQVIEAKKNLLIRVTPARSRILLTS